MAATKRSTQVPAPLESDPPARFFKNQNEWSVWLDRHHRESSGLWLQIAKKGSNVQSVTYQQALEVALCYGWIDGQKKPDNDEVWLQRFLPRSARSLWSKINQEKAQALIASGKMKSAGLEAIERAKQTGRWNAAYDSPSKAAIPSDLQAAFDSSPQAKAFFESLDKANRYAVLWRIQTVKKPETRARKIAHFIAVLERGEEIHE